MVDVSVTMYPVTAKLSVAVSVEMAIVRDVAVEGTMKALTIGGIVSVATTGWLEASPGNVLAVISTIFVKPSPSESTPSIGVKLKLEFR